MKTHGREILVQLAHGEFLSHYKIREQGYNLYHSLANLLTLSLRRLHSRQDVINRLRRRTRGGACWVFLSAVGGGDSDGLAMFVFCNIILD